MNIGESTTFILGAFLQSIKEAKPEMKNTYQWLEVEAGESYGMTSSPHSVPDKCFSVSLPSLPLSLSFPPAGTEGPARAFSCTRLNSQWLHFQFAHSKVVIIL